MTTEKVDWVEIIEPKSKEHMYANLTTGECVWDPPVGVNVKKADNKQWWELFDQSTGRFYYYNATSQKTVWHRPHDSDIIPLAKLQTLKQNTEVVTADNSLNKPKKPVESVSTQTPGRSHPLSEKGSQGGGGSTVSSRTSAGDGDPSSPRSKSHHHHHHHREGCSRAGANDKISGRRGSQGSYSRHNHHHHHQSQQQGQQQDSGRSSDSSSVSLCRQLAEKTPGTPQARRKPSPQQPPTRANTFDINISIGGGYSLCQENRGSGSRGGRVVTGIARSQSFSQRQPRDGAETAPPPTPATPAAAKSADSPLDRESNSGSYRSQKLAPEYANVLAPSPRTEPVTMTDQHTNTPSYRNQNLLVANSREREMASSDCEEANGAWARKWEHETAIASLDSHSLEMWNSSSSNASDLHLPLHHYILEQAKLSGCYRFGGVQEEDDSPVTSDAEGARAPLPRTVEYDSDEFADDEGMSQQSSEVSYEEGPGPEREESEDDDRIEEDVPSYINTGHSTHYDYAQHSDHHYSDAADYMESCLRTQHTASLFYNTRLTPHTVRPVGALGSPPDGEVRRRPNDSVFLETQHASLKRQKDPRDSHQPLYSPIMERTELLLPEACCYAVHSLPNSPSPITTSFQYERLARTALTRELKLPSESDIEKYAQDNLNIHKKGIFRKKFSVRELLSWSKDPISKPMLVLSDKGLKKEAREVFKLVQSYMGDRKLKVGTSLDSVLLEITTTAHRNPAIRDELFIQICRQTTDNPRKESLRRGWELMAICLYFFPPSHKFQAYLESYMNRHRDPSYDFPEVGKWPIHVQVSHYASVACKRLQRIGVGGRRQVKKPTPEEIEQAKVQIFRPSMFGCTLEEVMALQKSRFPHYKLPWVQTTLSDEVLRLQGTHTEGIFRVSPDIDEVCALKQQIDRWERPTDCTDAHSPASLLKLWYRELYEPLIPDSLYEECIQYHDDAEQAAAIVETLPHLNKMVLAYLIRFLQIFARPEVVAVTKMDASNLAMVMAPNCLRCCCQEPRVMYENARKEMAFIRTLILNFDTGFIQGVL